MKACTKQLKSTARREREAAYSSVSWSKLANSVGRVSVSAGLFLISLSGRHPTPTHRSVYSRGGAGTRYEGRGIAYSLVRLKQFASSVGMAPDSAVVFRTLRANQETHVSQLRWPVKLLVACTTCRERWDTHNSCRRVNRPISVGMFPPISGAPATTMRVRTLWKLPISVGIDPVISFDSSEPASLWNRSTRQP